MPKKTWITYKGGKDNPNDVELAEDERRATLRTLQDPSRKAMQVDSKLASVLAEPIFKVEKAEFYNEENLKEFTDRKEGLDLDNDFYWVTYRVARNGVSVSRPGYFQFHQSLTEALDVVNQRKVVSKTIGEDYDYGILFKVKDERVFNGGKRGETSGALGAPPKEEEEKLKHRWAFFLSKPLLDRYLEYEEKYFEEHERGKRADVLRHLADIGMRTKPMLRIPILADDSLNVRYTKVPFAHRVNEADNEVLTKFMQKNRIRNKQDLMTRLIYTALRAEGIPRPDAFPDEDEED